MTGIVINAAGPAIPTIRRADTGEIDGLIEDRPENLRHALEDARSDAIGTTDTALWAGWVWWAEDADTARTLACLELIE